MKSTLLALAAITALPCQQRMRKFAATKVDISTFSPQAGPFLVTESNAFTAGLKPCVGTMSITATSRSAPSNPA